MPEEVRDEAITFRQPYQTLYYCIENGGPIREMQAPEEQRSQ